MDMNTVIRSIVPVAILGVCLLAMPVEGMAGKPDKPGKDNKGGTPNHNSVADTEACLVDDYTARVCSTKGISNVVLWCDGTWVKHEDFGPGEVYEATVGCVNDQGDLVGGGGRISMVAVKSGSQKNSKHHPDGYQTVDGAPSGSGLFNETELLECASFSSCATVSDDNPPPAGDVPVDDSPPVAGDVPVDDNPPVAGDDGGDPPADDGGSDDGDTPGVPIGDDPPNQDPPVYY